MHHSTAVTPSFTRAEITHAVRVIVRSAYRLYAARCRVMSDTPGHGRKASKSAIVKQKRWMRSLAADSKMLDQQFPGIFNACEFNHIAWTGNSTGKWDSEMKSSDLEKLAERAEK